MKKLEHIRDIRETLGFSQDDIAQALWLSRPTWVNIEWGKRELRQSELEKLSEIFDLPVDYLLWRGKHVSEIEVDPSVQEKFQNIVLYVLSLVWAKHNAWKKVLYKLLYFCEFDHFELHKKHLSGYPFIRLPMWPAPYGFDEMMTSMKDAWFIESVAWVYGGHAQQKFLPLVGHDEKLITKEERSFIRDIMHQYSDYNGKELSDKSHEDMPWRLTWDMEQIDYAHVQVRKYPYSPIAWSAKKKESQKYAAATGYFEDVLKEPDLYEDYRHV